MVANFNREVVGSYDRMARHVLDILQKPEHERIVIRKFRSSHVERTRLQPGLPKPEKVDSDRARSMIAPIIDLVHHQPSAIASRRPPFQIYAASDTLQQVTIDLLGKPLIFPANRLERTKSVITKRAGRDAGALFGAVVDLSQKTYSNDHYARTLTIPGLDLSVIYLSRTEYDLLILLTVLAHEYYHVLQQASDLWFFQSDDQSQVTGNRILMEGDAIHHEENIARLLVRELNEPKVLSAFLYRQTEFLHGAIQMIRMHSQARSTGYRLAYNPITFNPHVLGVALMTVAEEVLGPQIYEQLHQGDLGFLERLA